MEDAEEDQMTEFLLYSHSVIQEGRFLLEALPNVNNSAVKWAQYNLSSFDIVSTRGGRRTLTAEN